MVMVPSQYLLPPSLIAGHSSCEVCSSPVSLLSLVACGSMAPTLPVLSASMALRKRAILLSTIPLDLTFLLEGTSGLMRQDNQFK
jgi:hypothetical protein